MRTATRGEGVAGDAWLGEARTLAGSGVTGLAFAHAATTTAIRTAIDHRLVMSRVLKCSPWTNCRLRSPKVCPRRGNRTAADLLRCVAPERPATIHGQPS